MENKSKISQYIDTVWLAVGELIVALLIVGGYMIFGKFDYAVVTGAALGGTVTVVNLLILSVSVNRAINQFVEERGTKEMDEEEAAEYAQKHGAAVQGAMAKSYLFRMFLMAGSLFLALVTGWFRPLATAIPLLMYRPILYVTEFIKVKSAKRGE